MYCINCGKKLNDNELYCTECGTKSVKGNDIKKDVSNESEILDNNLSENVKEEILDEKDKDVNIEGTVNDDNSKTVTSTNNINSFKNKDQWPKKLIIALVFGIIAMFTGPVFSIITLILAIIGLVFSLKCSDFGSVSIGVVIVNVLGILSSLLGIFIAICIALAILFPDDTTSKRGIDDVTEDKTSYIENTWYCGLNSNVDSSNYSLIMSFDNGQFELKNKSTAYIRGSYNIVDANYGIYKYRLNYYVDDSSINTSSSSYYYIDVDRDSLQLYSTGSYKTYYCTTNFGSQNQL